jgi:hypothetical protein
MESSSLRVAYIRTLTTPDEPYDLTYNFLANYVKQKSPDDLLSAPKHRFLFGASNSFDTHMLDIFLCDRHVPSKYPYGHFGNLQRSDLELRMSECQAATGSGRRIIERCSEGGIPTTISGADDAECDAIMLEECDYVIDQWVESSFESSAWYWNTARPGIRQDTLLTNPKYDMSKHDVSKTRLSRRYAGYGWKASSGGMHGNGGDWRCRDCGGKCKRGKCRINPGEDREVPEWKRLPAKGSAAWKDITADEACRKMRYQRLPGAWTGIDEYCSIDTFSGD